MTDLTTAVRAVSAAERTLRESQEAFVRARAAVVAAAVAEGVTERCVLVIGATAWYIDPPSARMNLNWPDGWGVTWGSVPKVIGASEEKGEVPT